MQSFYVKCEQDGIFILVMDVLLNSCKVCGCYVVCFSRSPTSAD